MNSGNSGVEFHPRLVEDSVLAAIRTHPERRAFERERERIYEETPGEEREGEFDRLHGHWFEHLGLARAVTAALDEQREDLPGVGRILAGPAPAVPAEGVELYVNEAGEKSIIISLTAGRLADAEGKTLEFLRRELLHVADMLDASFAYEPRLPAHPCGPAHDRRRQERYRALWNCSVDGRLAAAGLVDPASACSSARRQLRRAFPVEGEAFDQLFERVFTGPRPTHGDFVGLATGAATAAPGESDPNAFRPDRCPVCGFPTMDFEPAPENIGEETLAWIAADFPGWRPSDGICPQCADLYRARGMSLAALATLPGIR